jgi:predicted nucleotidyltransferase
MDNLENIQRALPQLGSPAVQSALAELCRRYDVLRLAVFGSTLHNNHRPDSDLDLLVEFAPGRTPGFRFFELQQALSDLLGKRVDLNTPAFLSRYIRDQIVSEAEDLYLAA